jgi:hypothetical protein
MEEKASKYAGIQPPFSFEKHIWFQFCVNVVLFAVQVEEEAEDDYSASVNAIIQRRNSARRPSKRKNRRASSPFPAADADSGQSRRRSSVFTTSSIE